MKSTTPDQDLGERIERLVREEISTIREAVRGAVERAFAAALAGDVAARPQQGRPATRQAGKRRATSEVAALGERLCAAVCERPGETMSVLAPLVGATSRELHRPATLLRRAGRIRSVGTRHATRYFPMATVAEAAE
jgi:hypothetical protein